jgi:hypothetical protein
MSKEHRSISLDLIMGNNGALDAYLVILNLCDQKLVSHEIQIEILDIMANRSLSTHEKTTFLHGIIGQITSSRPDSGTHSP